MALGTEEKAYNTALVALITAWKAVYDAATTGEVLSLVPVDIGQDSTYNTGTRATAVGDLSTAGTGPVPSFARVYIQNQVNDGEYPITLPGTQIPMFYAITNQAHELDLT